MEWDAIMNAITLLGFPAVCLIFLGMFVYKLISRLMDENKEREEKTTQLLNEISTSIKKSTEINSELAETNRLLVDKVNDDLIEIKTKLGIEK